MFYSTPWRNTTNGVHIDDFRIHEPRRGGIIVAKFPRSGGLCPDDVDNSYNNIIPPGFREKNNNPINIDKCLSMEPQQGGIIIAKFPRSGGLCPDDVDNSYNNIIPPGFMR